MTPAIRLTAAGFVATAMAFGPARMGFGLSPFFRISYATSMDALETACERIHAACAELS